MSHEVVISSLSVEESREEVRQGGDDVHRKDNPHEPCILVSSPVRHRIRQDAPRTSGVTFLVRTSSVSKAPEATLSK